MILGVSLCFATAVLAQTPVIGSGGVVNAASYALDGLPNSALSQGGMFIVFGSNLGPSTLARASSFPLPTNLGGTSPTNGTSISVTVSGTTTQAIILYTSAGQVAAIMRSNTPTGTGTMRLTYNGRTSATAPVRVVAASFGAFTINQQGTGAAVITNADNQVISALNPATPGQTVILWGTGLGPITGDETQPPAAGNLSTPVTALVGVTNAQVVYKGRAPCCAGLDQINFIVPQGQLGCAIPVLIRVNNIISNSATIAVSNGGPCSDPTGLSSESLQLLQSQGSLRIGSVFITRNTSDTPAFPGVPATTNVFEAASGNFARVDQAAILQSQGSFNQVSIGGCVVVNFSGQQSAPSFPSSTPLDAGASLSLNGPGGTRNVPKLAAAPGSYFTQLANAAPFYVAPGSHTFTGPGGADVGPFNASVTVPTPFTWTNAPFTTINRSQDFTITWTGGPSGSYIVIGGYSAVINTDNTSYGTYFYCLVPPNPGRFTIPSAVLLALPVTTVTTIGTVSFPSGSIYVGSYVVNPFTASGLDQGYVGYTDTFAKLVAYQ
jgi:uncharacterized protein (TIGR03437 family)